MSGARKLERLCNPLFLAICHYWQMACINSPVELKPFRENILALLEDVRNRTGEDEDLAGEFALIEKPLVFFIDYMVREGRFSFRDKWHILARGYNELSGDEKFFDLLEETLKNPDAAGSAPALFFVMLGLGFDGMYRRNQGHIQDCLSRCAEKSGTDLTVFSRPLVPETKKRGIFARRRRPGVRFALIASALIMAAGFAGNMAVFLRNTAEYRRLLSNTALDAVPSVEDYAPSEPDEAPAPDPQEGLSLQGGEYDLVYPVEDDSTDTGGEEGAEGEE
jgi:type VI protein secretion system component VasF